MTRYFTRRVRKSGYRDAKLFVIASEGSVTEPQYFYAIAKYYRNPRIRVLPILPNENRTSPKHILENIKNYSKQNHLRADDERWLIIDRDNWTEKELSYVTTESRQLGVQIAVSNPCFEFWLLLHLVDISHYSVEKLNNFCTHHSRKGRENLESEIRSICGCYNASNPDVSIFIPNIENAIRQARIIDAKQSTIRWPKKLGTRVYLLVEKLIGYL
jgi:hypothetical protein